MADETPEPAPLVNVDVLSEARGVCWQAARELRSIVRDVDVAVLHHVADQLDDYAEAFDDFMAEVNAEDGPNEFEADRYPADPEPDDEDDDEPEDDPDAQGDPAVDEVPEPAPLNHDELYAEAQRLNIPNRTKMSDPELAEAIAEAQTENRDD